MSKQTDLINILDAITVDGSNNVGIGVVPESSFPDRPMLRIGSGLGLMCRASGNPSHTWINSNAYQDPSSADDKYIATDEASQIRQTNGSIHFMTAESGSANATISWTNAMSVMKTGGITFNGDTAAANALNDYEEGDIDIANLTFTGSGSATTNTNYQTLRYTKVGQVVSITGNIFLASVTSQNGALKIPLPFTSGTGEKHRTASGTANASSNTPTFIKVDAGSSFGTLITSSGFSTLTISAGQTYLVQLTYNTA
jgi:hypothetical protein